MALDITHLVVSDFICNSRLMMSLVLFVSAKLYIMNYIAHVSGARHTWTYLTEYIYIYFKNP